MGHVTGVWAYAQGLEDWDIRWMDGIPQAGTFYETGDQLEITLSLGRLSAAVENALAFSVLGGGGKGPTGDRKRIEMIPLAYAGQQNPVRGNHQATAFVEHLAKL